jgi:hypothetical protein
MVECDYCREWIEGDREEVGARCPRCREPLYEEPEVYERPPRVSRRPPGLCPVHTQSTAVGICQRCGNFICVVCRTRWHGRNLCPVCVERGLEANASGTHEATAHRRQAGLSLLFGGLAWGLTLLAMLLARLGTPDGRNQGWLALANFLLFTSPLASVLGAGQGAAAVRRRGDQMILATFGLLLSGLHLGTAVGLFIAFLRIKEAAGF